MKFLNDGLKSLHIVPVILLAVSLPIGGVIAAPIMGGPDGSRALPEVSAQEDINAMLPASIREDGTITIVMTTSSPPAHYTTDDGMRGLDHDLAAIIAQVMGLEPTITGAPFDQVIPGLQAHRYEVVVSQFKPSVERGKVLDFVNYAQSGTSLGVLNGNPENLSVDTLCGVLIGVQKGSSQAIGTIPELSEKCTEAGKKPIAKKTFRDSTTALLALRSKRVDGVLIDSPVMGYAAKQSNRFELVGTIASNPVGIGVLKDSGLVEPIQKALQYLNSEGAYQKVFDAWGMEVNMVSDFTINQLQD